jgi:RimJ/RimL family protein N-acetyltransferase
LAEVQLVREWRNAPDVLPMLRTGYKTEEEQAAFYRRHIAPSRWTRLRAWALGREKHRYYAINWKEHYDAKRGLGVSWFVGMGGLTYLNRTAGEAEISLIIGPMYRGSGIGAAAVDALLVEANLLGLTSVRGVCLDTGNLGFWTQQIRRIPARMEWRWTL